MRRNPKQRDRPFKNKAPLNLPIQSRQYFPKGKRRYQSAQRSSTVQNMRIGHFMNRHKNRSERRVHHDADHKRTHHLFCTQRPLHGFNRLLHAQTLQKIGRSGRKGFDGNCNPHTQQTPYNGSRQNTKTLRIIISGFDSEAYGFPQRSQNGKFQEGHSIGVGSIDLHIKFPQRSNQAERQDENA